MRYKHISAQVIHRETHTQKKTGGKHKNEIWGIMFSKSV